MGKEYFFKQVTLEQLNIRKQKNEGKPYNKLCFLLSLVIVHNIYYI